ncbi:hypothetical protein EYF80_028169 [Liparis tanakae]|uniref:Uncharacterized protein n=1 Tax=Liparis tanakae TaxID=230148 RepID=A0A4Z2H6L4_9TELE|nr:hypothetical protein EYF80_028169 [Liparis tanakae]
MNALVGWVRCMMGNLSARPFWFGLRPEGRLAARPGAQRASAARRWRAPQGLLGKHGARGAGGGSRRRLQPRKHKADTVATARLEGTAPQFSERDTLRRRDDQSGGFLGTVLLEQRTSSRTQTGTQTRTQTGTPRDPLPVGEEGVLEGGATWSQRHHKQPAEEIQTLREQERRRGEEGHEEEEEQERRRAGEEHEEEEEQERRGEEQERRSRRG